MRIEHWKVTGPFHLPGFRIQGMANRHTNVPIIVMSCSNNHARANREWLKDSVQLFNGDRYTMERERD